MELSKQVCSLELSQKLKNLGFKQESLFYWKVEEKDNDYWIDKNTPVYNTDVVIGRNLSINGNSVQMFSAYTVAELGEMLPADLWKNSKRYSLEMRKQPSFNGSYYLNYWHEDEDILIKDHSIVAITESDARAKMLIYLKENNLIN